MEFKRTLVLSTGHLPQKEFELLEEASEILSFRFINHEYGAILVLDVEECKTTEGIFWSTYSPNLKPIIDLALANDCVNIEFDCDGEEIECLKVWNW